MEAEMYGIIPNAKMEALENAPPENIFNKASDEDPLSQILNLPYIL